MNISKKAFMSFIIALTSLVAMAQPYYHVMKREGIILTEEAAYNAKNYKIRVDMEKPRPKDAIGGRITLEHYDCDKSSLKRSFYFTKHGNVYYNNSEGKFYFENSQLDYPRRYSKDHCGHFCWDSNLEGCIDVKSYVLNTNATETYFYFADPANLPKLKEDLGNEEWAVLAACEWSYVCENLGEYGWKVDGKTCFLIDATPGKSLLTELRNKNNGNPRDLSIDEFKSLEAQGLVCLPASGLLKNTSLYGQNITGYYWSSTPSNDMLYGQGKAGVHSMDFDSSRARTWSGPKRRFGYAVRLVILAD